MLKFAKYPLLDDEPGAAGGGGGQPSGQEGGDNGGDNQIDFNDPRIIEHVKNAISESTTQLKNKNNELLGKLSTATTKLQGYGDTSPEQLQQIMNVLQNNEEAQLIADGKFDEVITKRTDRMKSEYDEQITGLNSNLETAQTEAGKYKSLYENKIIDDQIRAEAVKQGVRPEAYDDILRRGRDVFTLDDDGTLVARDKDGVLVKDGKGMLLNPERFLSNLQESAPYYWPDSQGAGANGQTNNGNNQKTDVEDLESVATSNNGNFDLEEYRTQRKAMSGDNYHRR